MAADSVDLWTEAVRLREENACELRGRQIRVPDLNGHHRSIELLHNSTAL